MRIRSAGFIILAILISLLFTYCTSSSSKEPLPNVPEEKPRVVHVGLVADAIIGITIADGSVEYGHQVPYVQEKGDNVSLDDHGNRWLRRKGKVVGNLAGKEYKILMTFDRIKGERLNAADIDKNDSYAISSSDDPNYRDGTSPVNVYRKSRPSDLARVGLTFEAPMEHVLYLKLPAPLKKGKNYTVSFKLSDLPQYAFTYDPMKLRSEAVHVSQIGFRPEDQPKVAYLSLWMGSGGPLDYQAKTRFSVLDEATGKAALTGQVSSSKSLKEKNEDAYGHNFNGTNVYRMDFSSLNKPGVYRVCVEGIGCSYPFQIEDDVWLKAFYVSVRGLYHQRSGMEIGPPYTTFKRPRCFHPDDGVKVYGSTTPLMDTPNGFLEGTDNFSKLVAGKTAQIVSNAWGGYCDAGDWDRRIQHLDTARLLLELAELFPDFCKKQNLNIPRSPDTLPDIINEALWGIDFFRRLQTPEGGIRGGIESDGHPLYGEASWQESRNVLAYAPDLWSSYLYAGVAARAALWLKSREPGLSATYEQSALRAMDWAEREMKKVSQKKYAYEISDARNLASAELFRLTGAKGWHDLFIPTTAFRKAGTPLFKYKSHDQGEAAWVYCRINNPGIQNSLKNNCRDAIIQEADDRILTQQKTGFGWTKYPWRPAIGTTFTVPDCIPVVRAHAITGDPKYLRAIILATQTGAGANPLNMCYTTGLGHKNPQHVMHVDSRITRQKPPPGITVLGPLDVEMLGEAALTFHRLAGKFCYPSAKDWPVIENYWDVYWYPQMCEFTVQHTIAPNAYVWGYLAATTKKAGPSRQKAGP
jgi:endoglucanase